MKILSLVLAISALSAAGARADDVATKGYCTLNDQRFALKRVPGVDMYGAAWTAEVAPGLTAEVSFRPGYGMTFVSLELKDSAGEVARTTLSIDGGIGPDSGENDAPRPMQRFQSISLSARTAAGPVDCGYGLYRG
jgi:hypothetical protein